MNKVLFVSQGKPNRKQQILIDKMIEAGYDIEIQDTTQDIQIRGLSFDLVLVDEYFKGETNEI